MKVQVYVRRFVNDLLDDREYRKAVEFELPDSERDHYRLLEYVFEQLNVGGDLVEATDWCKRYRARPDGYSLSVDDVVVLGDKAWRVARVGWEPVAEPAEGQTEVAA